MKCVTNLGPLALVLLTLGCDDPGRFAPAGFAPTSSTPDGGVASSITVGSQTLECPAGTTVPSAEAITAPSTVTLDPAQRYQSLDGFGASIAWYQGNLVTHPARAAIYDLIFGQLGLDILRLRNRYQENDQRTDEPIDLGQEQEILAQATASLGARPRVLLSSWSPPAALKQSNFEKCGTAQGGASGCTLRKVEGQFDYAGFASYWYDSLAAYSTRFGIVPDYISLQNEPDFAPNGWEGCRFDPYDGAFPGYAEALRAVTDRLALLGAPPRVIGPETLGIQGRRATPYLQALDPKLLYGVAHHLYQGGNTDWRQPGPDSYLGAMTSLREAAGSLPVFQTEFATNEDQGTEGGLETAWLIHNSLERENAAGFLYWDLVWGRNGGLVSLVGSEYAVRDQYYSVRHYARFTDPGYQRIAASSSSCLIRATAFVSPDEQQASVVLLNVGDADDTVTLETGSFGWQSSEVYRTVYRPGQSERWAELGGLGADRTVSLPSRSVATVVLRK